MQMGERSRPYLLAHVSAMRQFVICEPVERQSVVAATGNIARKGIRRSRWGSLDQLIHIVTHETIDALFQFESLIYVILGHLLHE
jgi:hypothetical protein